MGATKVGRRAARARRGREARGPHRALGLRPDARQHAGRPSGLKTRDFDDILREVELTFDVHEGCGTPLGGVHFEMTGEDVTECIGGAAGITVDDLDRNYASACDPRLNYRQALEMGFRIAKRLGSHVRAR